MNSVAYTLTLDDIRRAFPGNPPRLHHIEGVISLAKAIDAASVEFGGKLETAAVYHDAGYAEKWNKIRFHPVDSAILAMEHKQPEDIVRAVLDHSGSWGEARHRGRSDLFSYYTNKDSLLDRNNHLSRALTFCDMHTGPTGDYVSLEDRLADIRARRKDDQALMKTLGDYDALFHEINEEWQPRAKTIAQGAFDARPG